MHPSGTVISEENDQQSLIKFYLRVQMKRKSFDSLGNRLTVCTRFFCDAGVFFSFDELLESQKFSTIKLPMSLCRLQGLFGAVELNAVCCFRWVSPTLHKYDDAGNA